MTCEYFDAPDRFRLTLLINKKLDRIESNGGSLLSFSCIYLPDGRCGVYIVSTGPEEWEEG